MNRRLAAAAVLAGALIGAPAAAADTAVVSATVFTGAAGTTGAGGGRVVELSTLDACPPYAGPGALTLYPGGSTDTLPTGTWTLAEILQCGLQIPLSDLDAVAVQRPDGASQAPLSPAALTDTSDYADPAAPGALPVVSNDGGQAQNTYTRPWRGGRDENGRDQVTDSGPVQLLVYEHAAPLVVHLASHSIRQAAHHERLGLSATVTTAAGASVPASALGWRWTLSTGAGSRAATPAVTIPRGTTVVSVLVSDGATDSSGTASVALTYKPVRSNGARSGGGGHGTVHSTSGLGSAGDRHHATGTGHGRSRSGAGGHGSTNDTTSTTGVRTATTTTTTSATAAPGTTPAGTTTPDTTPTAPPAQTTATATSPATTTPAHKRPAARPHHPASRSVGGTLVRGQLLADVVPLSPARSPLAHRLLAAQSAAVASPAPTGRLTIPAALAGGVAVLGLLLVGAAREQRRRSPRLHR